jgi:hypothetical protein
MSGTHGHDHGSASDTVDEKKKSRNLTGIGIGAGALILLVFFFILKIFFFSSDSSENEKSVEGAKTSHNSMSGNRSLSYVIDVQLTEGYGETIYLPSSALFTFINPTTPYCVKNSSGVETCGEQGQDISTSLGDEESNKELQFKSQNKTGTLKILVTTKN